MPIKITDSKGVEGSTIVFKCDFTDEDGVAVAPVTLTWTWTDTDGTVINSREDVEVVTPASTEHIVLTGDDLQIVGVDGDQESRIFTLKWTYDSTYGTGLYGKESVQVAIENLVSED